MSFFPSLLGRAAPFIGNFGSTVAKGFTRGLGRSASSYVLNRRRAAGSATRRRRPVRRRMIAPRSRFRARRRRSFRRRRPFRRDSTLAHSTSVAKQTFQAVRTIVYALGSVDRTLFDPQNADQQYQFIWNFRAFTYPPDDNPVSGFPFLSSGERPAQADDASNDVFYMERPSRRFVASRLHIRVTLEQTLARRVTMEAPTLQDVIDSNVAQVQDNMQVCIVYYKRRDGRSENTYYGPVGPATETSSVIPIDTMFTNINTPFKPSNDGTYKVLRIVRRNFSGLKPYSFNMTLPGGLRRFLWNSGQNPIADSVNPCFGVQIFVWCQDSSTFNSSIYRTLKVDFAFRTSAYIIQG